LKEREMKIAENELASQNALRSLFASGQTPTTAEMVGIGGAKGLEMASQMARIRESEARAASAQSKQLKDQIDLGRTSLAAIPDDPKAYGAWRRDYVSKNPALAAFFPEESQYMVASPEVMGTKRQLLLSADQLARDENALNRLNMQLKSQQEIAEANRKAAADRTMMSLESQEERARLQRELEQEKNKYVRQLKEQELDPEFQAIMAEARERGKLLAKNDVEAKAQLPQVIANAEVAVDLIDQLIGKQRFNEKGEVIDSTPAHKGFSEVVGAGFGTRFIPGTSGASADALLDQILGGVYLEAFETLKGGGQITEKEGQAATAAKSRMSRAQSEEEFIKAAREYQKIVMTGVERARQKAGVTSNSILDEADAIVGQ